MLVHVNQVLAHPFLWPLLLNQLASRAIDQHLGVSLILVDFCVVLLGLVKGAVALHYVVSCAAEVCLVGYVKVALSEALALEVAVEQGLAKAEADGDLVWALRFEDVAVRDKD